VLAAASCTPTAPLVPGEPIREIALRTLDGQESRLSTFRGTNVLVHFWATWCATCREELASLSRITREIPEITVVAVAVEDEPDAVTSFIAAEKIPFPVLLDVGEARGDFSIPSLPYTVLLNSRGQMIPFLDPASGDRVNEVAASRYWASGAAIDRLRQSLP